MDESLIAANLNQIRLNVERRCLAKGVDPAGITILGVTKSFPAEIASMGVKAGLTELGENKVQEAEKKIPRVRPRPRWHLIGHLQTNKAKKAVEIFDVIESIDSLNLAEVISKRAMETSKGIEVYLQVNSSGEKTKHGFEPVEIYECADKINKLPGLKLNGLMTLGPLTENLDLVKRSFELTRGIFEKLSLELGKGFRTLSMGMSGDFELALDYGANEIRIGTAIFGPRSKAN